MAVRRSRHRASGSMATAPGIETSAVTPLVRTLALKFCIGFIRSRAALDVGLASVSPELDHFFLAKRRAGDPWPSADRAIELAGRWQQHPASNQRRNPLWCGLLALKFCIGFIRSRAALDVGLASVSPELDHFFLAKRRAGDPWPSADRAIELAGRWQQHPASNQRRNPLWCGLSLSNFASALSVRAPRSMSASPRSRLSSTISF